MILTYIILILNGIFDSIVDTIRHHWKSSVFSEIKNKFWFNFFYVDSWENKYEKDEKDILIRKDLDGDGDTELIRKSFRIFGMSIPVPVQFTDAFHFFKLMRIVGYFVGISYWAYRAAVGDSIITGLIDKIPVPYGISIPVIIGFAFVCRNKVFTLFYHNIWMKKNAEKATE